MPQESRTNHGESVITSYSIHYTKLYDVSKDKVVDFERQKGQYTELKEEISKKELEIRELNSYKKLAEDLKKKNEELLESLGEKENYISELFDKIGDYETHKSETLMNILIDEEKELIELIV